MITIQIKTTKGTSNISWNDENQIRYYDFNQTARYVRALGKDLELAENLDFDLWKELVSMKIQRQIQNLLGNDYVDDILSNKSANILSVGSGTSTLELALASYFPHSRFYLVDKDQYNLELNSAVFTDNRFGDDTVFQNSWKPFEDGVITSNLDRSRFTLLEPTMEWPEDIDLIYSFYSWGWHYNYPDYIDRLSQLKVGGMLVLTVLLLQYDVDYFINSIGEKLKSQPTVKYYEVSQSERSKLQFGDVPQKAGIFIWKKI